MAKPSKKNVYVIQKFVAATSIAEALKKERKGTIVEICLAIKEPGRSAVQAVGFLLRPDGNENIDYV